jgi:hypothetical protein
VLTVDGKQEAWIFALTEPDEEDENDPWTKVSPSQGLVEHYRDRFIGMIDGAVVLVRYEELGGDAAIDVDRVTEWVLTRVEAWTATAVPGGIVHSVIPAGGRTGAGGVVVPARRWTDLDAARAADVRGGVAGARVRRADGRAGRRRGGRVGRRLFVAVHRRRAWAGVPDVERGAGLRGVPPRSQHGPGQALPLAPRMRAVFKQLAGDWRLAADGRRRGCPAG